MARFFVVCLLLLMGYWVISHVNVVGTSLPSRAGAPNNASRLFESGPLEKRIDFGDMESYFEITKVRLDRRTDRHIDPTGFYVISFVVEAPERTPHAQFLAYYLDRDGVQMGQPEIVMFEPDYLTQYMWPAGARARGWFLIPDEFATLEDSQRVGKIEMRRMK